jgi:glycosyltransferase involved in cell wall biosynthesis
MRIVILDIQPIDPPTGGARLRLLGLYHALGGEAPAQYVGTYDWRGPRGRRQMLSPGLVEQLVPLSDQHFAAAKARSRACLGRPVVDVTFPRLARLSPEYVAAARAAVRDAEIVVFSHPWVFPVVRAELAPERQLVVYDAHNVEGLLRLELLGDGGEGAQIARDVAKVEFELCHAANLILACSQEDRDAFVRLYGVRPDAIRIVPNGAFVRSLAPALPDEKAAIRRALRLGPGPVALFLGSDYGPNAEAAGFIASTLAPELPDVQFVVAGGVGRAMQTRGRNLRRTGVISADEKRIWLAAADLAVNPMFSGSGTNIKMLEFMAAGLPIVTTEVGARGLESQGDALVLADGASFARAVAVLAADSGRRRELGARARGHAERSYAWERISGDLGAVLRRRRQTLDRPRPYFSVIVPTYERPAFLTTLVHTLAEQSWRDFELIVVDQSQAPWPDRDRDFGLDLTYVHTDLKGAVFARNRGADLAGGQVLAFTDDDCQPVPGWLAAAQAEFAARPIVGLEGLITSGLADDPLWRPVTNEGFEGVGFMTANLFVRADAFHRTGGFDVAFDHPHFREDTDLGWRLQAVGDVPFSRAAAVHHPPQPRSLERESLEARSAYFEKDALLLRKHPSRYAKLMRSERQWRKNPLFWTHFLKGLRRYGVELPPDVRSLVPRQHLREAVEASPDG